MAELTLGQAATQVGVSRQTVAAFRPQKQMAPSPGNLGLSGPLPSSAGNPPIST